MQLCRFVSLKILILVFCIGISPMKGDPVIQNASFEESGANGFPAYWTKWNNVGVDTSKTCSAVQRADAPNGKIVAQLSPTSPQITIISQNLQKLVPGQWYEVSAMMRCENALGHGCRLSVEYWQGSAAYGSLDSEPMIGTQGWKKVFVRFQAPSKKYRVQLDFSQSGASGTMWADHFRIKKIATPSFDVQKRKVLDTPLWGMFPWPYDQFERIAPEMSEAGVYWIRMGGGSTAPEMQKIAQKYGMVFETCLDGMPGANDPKDMCYPVTNSTHYLGYLNPYIEKPAPQVRILELFNEPNLVAHWGLEGYSNLLNFAGKAIKDTKTNVLVGTGGFGLPYIGYVEACLKRDKAKVTDIVLIHPYCVDEGLDSHLWAVTEACNRAGRSEIYVAINETGWPTWDPDTGYKDLSQFVSEETQASNIVKLHVQALAHRISFINYLTWQDFTSDGDQSHNMGLLRVDGSKKQSYYAYRFMTKTIGSRRVKDWSYENTGTRIYRFDGAKPLWVVWNALRNADITIDTGETAVFPCDIFGAKTTVTPVQGKVELNVGDEPIYLVPAEGCQK